MEDLTGWIGLLWSAVALLAGMVAGGFWSELRRTQLSDTLTRASDRIRALDSKSDHFAFGITDLEVRIRAADNEIAMLRSDLKVRRATYDRLNGELRLRWDEALECKRELAEQEQKADNLQREISKWKSKLGTLHERMAAGEISDRGLKRELAAGLSEIFKQAGDELPTVQRLLLENTIAIGLGDDTTQRSYQEMLELMYARIELLESQVRYWQDRSTGRIGADQPAPTPAAADAELQEVLPFEEFAATKATKPHPARRPSKKAKKVKGPIRA